MLPNARIPISQRVRAIQEVSRYASHSQNVRNPKYVSNSVAMNQGCVTSDLGVSQKGMMLEAHPVTDSIVTSTPRKAIRRNQIMAAPWAQARFLLQAILAERRRERPHGALSG